MPIIPDASSRGTTLKQRARLRYGEKLDHLLAPIGSCQEEGVYATMSEIGDAENISKSYVSRILRLALLAPDIVGAILSGQTDQALMLENLERPLPSGWAEQRRVLLNGVGG